MRGCLKHILRSGKVSWKIQGGILGGFQGSCSGELFVAKPLKAKQRQPFLHPVPNTTAWFQVRFAIANVT